MTMHLVRGMTSLNMKKRKPGKRSRQTRKNFEDLASNLENLDSRFKVITILFI